MDKERLCRRAIPLHGVALPTMTRWARFWIAAGLAAVTLPGGALAVGALFVPDRREELAQTVGTTGRDRDHDMSDGPWNQIRIEQHLIIRITPGGPAVMRDMPPPAPLPLPLRLHRRRMPPCVQLTAIAGVRPLAGERLLLLMRDHRLVGADLSRTCAARDFYLGFYVTPTPDGQLCADRDSIHSRAGTTCMITGVHEMVPAN
jgi:hypothetical protein